MVIGDFATSLVKFELIRGIWGKDKTREPLVNAGFTHCRLLLPFESRQRYDTNSEKVGLLFSIIWNVLSLSELSRFSS